jgi:hypothetical protein
MNEFTWYLLFLFGWTFFHSLWIARLSKQVAALKEAVERRG